MNRLTKFEYDDFKALKPKQCIVSKLGKLEDILEKYGIESVEELERHLSYTVEYDVLTRLEYDRDTWKRACGLACKQLDETNNAIGFYTNKTPTRFIYNNEYVNYFYQQAQKEMNDEK